MSEPSPETADAADDTAPATRQRPTDRYGTGPAVRRRWVPLVFGVVAVLAGLAVAYVGYQTYGPDEIETEQLGYTVVDDSTLTVRIKVTREDPGQPVVCFVRAMDRDSAEVGRREVLIEPSDSGTIEQTTTVRSSSRPAAGDIFGCSSTVPGYLRAG